MLIAAELIIQAVFISAIFLATISIPKQLYYILYLRYTLAKISHGANTASKLYKEGKLTKEKYEEYLEYRQGQKAKKEQFIEEMKAWEQFVKSIHEPMIETITSEVLILAILLVPENLISGPIGSILMGLLVVQGTLIVAATMSIWLRKMSASYDNHFQEVAELSRKKRKKRL